MQLRSLEGNRTMGSAWEVWCISLTAEVERGWIFLEKETMRAKVWPEKCALHSQMRVLKYRYWKSWLDYSGGSIVRSGSRLGASLEMKRLSSQ